MTSEPDPFYVDDVPLCRSECPHFVARLKLDGTQRARSRWKCDIDGRGNPMIEVCRPAVRRMAEELEKLQP